MNTTGNKSGTGSVSGLSRVSTSSGKKSIQLQSVGNGIESGRFGNRSTFGNTARYEAGYSSRSFASFGKGEAIHPRAIPSFSINHEGVVVQKAKKEISKKASNHSRALVRQFGPRLEAVKGFSLDRSVPDSFSHKNAVTLFERSKSKQNGINTVQNELPARLSAKNIPHRSNRSSEFIAKEHRQGNKPTPEIVLRRSANVDSFSSPYTQVTINEQGNIIPQRKGFTLPVQTREAFMGKNHYIPVTREGNIRNRSNGKQEVRNATKLVSGEDTSQESAPQLIAASGKPSSEKGKTRKLSRSKADTVRRAQEMLEQKRNKQRMTDSLYRPARRVTSPQEQHLPRIVRKQHPLSNMHISTLQGKTAHAEQTLLNVMDQKPFPYTAHAETTDKYSSEIPVAEGKNVTGIEKQAMLDRYIATEIQVASPDGQPLAIASDLAHETSKDVEQAVLVQQLVKLAYPQLTEQQSEALALRALNVKLEKTHTKEAVLREVSVAAKTQPQFENDEPAWYETSALPEIVAEPVIINEMKQDVAGAQTAIESDSELLTSSDTNTLQSGTLPLQHTDQVVTEEEQLHEADESKHEMEVRKETDWTKDLEIPYEVYEKKNKERQEVAITIARMIQGDAKEKLISGKEIAEAMKGFYDELKSPIVPDDVPDDYLTNIINAIGSGNFVSVKNLADKIALLTYENPAITIGMANNISKEQAERLKRSTNYPR